jgi:hypothetical protein
LTYAENRVDLTKYRDQYSYFPKLTYFIFGELAHEIRRKGYLEREDFILILLWKRQLFQINLKQGELLVPLRKEDQGKTEKTVFSFEPDEMKIREVTKKIFSTNPFAEAEVAHLLEDLSSLRGVKLKTATAILAVVFPLLYGVVDRHVLRQLGIQVRAKTVKERAKVFANAISELRKIAHEQMEKYGGDWTPRMVDMALFVLDQQELAEQRELNERAEALGDGFDDLEDEAEEGEETEGHNDEKEDTHEKDYLPYGYDDILHPKGDGDYDSDEERD